ncbi:hypothetical protein IAU60_006674 [Kwoniella sp. DSM 27419]
MCPPPLPTPPPSNSKCTALVLRNASIPSSTPPQISVKVEPGITGPSPSRSNSLAPSSPRHSLPTFKRAATVTPTRRRTPSLTPSPRGRSSSTTPSSSSAARFKAQMAALAAKRQPRFNTPSRATPGHGRSSIPAPVSVSREEDQFWRGSDNSDGSSSEQVNVDESPSSSPTPGSSIALSRRCPRYQRADTELSTASLGSAFTACDRAPTYDDADVRYGRSVPSANTRRKDELEAASSALAPMSPLPPRLASAIAGMMDRLKSLAFTDVKPGVPTPDKIGLVLPALFPKSNQARDRLTQAVMADAVSPVWSEETVEGLLVALRSLVVNALEAYTNDYKDYKGTRETRKAFWFATFKAVLYMTTADVRRAVGHDDAIELLLTLRTVWSQGEGLGAIIGRMGSDCGLS